MEGILSQEEVDALLKNFSDSSLDQEEYHDQEERKEDEIVIYDFTRREPRINYKMPILDIILERFTRGYGSTLSNILLKPVVITISSREIISFADFMKVLPIPASIHIIRIEPMKASCILVFKSELIFSLMEIIFGGKGSRVKVEGKDFTVIETKVISKLRDTLLKDMESSWEPVFRIHFNPVRSEISPDFIRIFPPEELFYSISFEVEVEKNEGEIKFLIPCSTLMPLKERLMANFQRDEIPDSSMVQKLKSLLMEAKVNVIVQLGTKIITCRDLLRMKKGDVITLDTYATDPVPVMVEGIRKFLAYPGRYRDVVAVQISSIEKRS
jgi:flagellar motor switch protein FliM